MTESSPPVPAVRAESRAAAVGTFVLVGVAGVLLFLATFAVWIDRVALETDVFADTSSELIEDDAIRKAVATKLIDELYDEVDVEEELEGPLPEDVESLAGPTAAVLRSAGPGVVERALEQPRLQRLWRETVERSHATLLELVEERSGTVSSEEGVVTLDLGDLILEASERLGVRDDVEDRLDEDTGRVVLFRSDELDTAQDSVRVLNALAWVLPLATLAAFALAVWAAGRRRRVAVRAIGVAVLLSGLVGLLAVNLAGWYVVGELASDGQSEAAGDNAWDIVTDLLRGSFRLQIAAGLLFLLAAWIAGPSARSVTVRRTIAPVVRDRRYAYGAVGVFAVLVLVSGRVDDFAGLLAELVFIGLLVAWIEWMHAQTLREFPDTQAISLAAARQRAAEWSSARRAPERAATPAPTGVDLTARLQQLAALHASGELSDEEYAAAKARVLSGE